MFAIGIPTFNEAANIASLVKLVDEFASELQEKILIINCDNNSVDGTSNIFKSTKTVNEKVSLTTSRPGKGRNLRRILEYVAKHKVDYCLFIDGDVTSLEREWLEKHLYQARSKADYVVPVYARYYLEGNTTNHFVYPVLQYWSKGRSPRQPIAGDFGVSKKFAEYLIDNEWMSSDLRYGVDALMTIHALFGGFKVREITLSKKIHAPSFEKAAGIFVDEAESYYRCRKILNSGQHLNFVKAKDNASLLTSDIAISRAKIVHHRQEANDRFAKNNLLQSVQILPKKIHDVQWASLLVEHENMVGNFSEEAVAQSLCPYFLIRMITYLEEATKLSEAEKIIADQTKLIDSVYSNAGY